jgi:two-component system sensor histidine kinase RegB
LRLLAAINLGHPQPWRLDEVGGARDGHGEPKAWLNEVFAHLAIDAGILGLLLYFAGGSANPFVSLFLLPPTLAAAMLPARHAWAMAGITLIAYTFLIFWKLAAAAAAGRSGATLRAARARHRRPSEHAAHSSGFALHVSACGSTS